MTSARSILLSLAVACASTPALASGDPPAPPPSPNAMMPMISLSSDVVDFGPELVGRTSPARQIVITNNGDAPLQFMGVSLMGGDAKEFAPAMVPTQFPVTIPPSTAVTITYTFKPTSDGTKKTTLSITSNDPTRPESTVQLTGTGIGNPITVAPARIDFGVFYQNAVVDQVAVRIANVSAWPINLQGPVIAGMDPDRFTIDMVVGTLMPGEVATAHVSYKTDKLGLHKGTITFTLADQMLTPPVLTLTGETVTGFIKVEPATIDFGSVLVGESAARTVTVTNLTSGPIKLATVRPVDQRFTVDVGGLLVNRIDAGASAKFTVGFAPMAMGPATGGVEIAREGSTKPDGTVTLTGTGSPPLIEGRGWACRATGRGRASDLAPVAVALLSLVFGARRRRARR